LGKGDPRTKFSGNPGTANITRQLGIGWGFIVLLLDVGRALILAKIGIIFLSPEWLTLLGFFLVLGNQKPLFHGFQGGKGVASYLGFTACICPIWAGISCLIWICVYGLFRKPFIGSFFMIAVLGLGMIQYSWSIVSIIMVTVTVIMIFFAHKSNVIAYKKDIQKTKVFSPLS